MAATLVEGLRPARGDSSLPFFVADPESATTAFATGTQPFVVGRAYAADAVASAVYGKEEQSPQGIAAEEVDSLQFADLE